MSSSAPVFRRCKPLLGTFVEVSVSGVPPAALEECFARAFARIEEVARAMSFHDPGSALSRLNRAPLRRWTEVGAELASVLALALELQRGSGGCFNAAIAEPLVELGFLPGRRRRVDWGALRAPGFEVRGTRARRSRRVRIDLGGIAKGYAVDRAVEAIRAFAPRARGCVNAGGDLRVFGRGSQEVWVRSGAEARPELRRARLSDEALATSSVRPQRHHERGASPYVDPPRARCLGSARTVVARAPSCALADAFTKIALLAPPRAARSLARSYGVELGLLP